FPATGRGPCCDRAWVSRQATTARLESTEHLPPARGSHRSRGDRSRSRIEGSSTPCVRGGRSGHRRVAISSSELGSISCLTRYHTSHASRRVSYVALTPRN